MSAFTKRLVWVAVSAALVIASAYVPGGGPAVILSGIAGFTLWEALTAKDDK